MNSYFNDDYHYGKIYKIRYEYNDKLYVGSSIRNLQERLQEHLTTKSSPVYKYKDDGPIIQLITLAPCKDRQELNKVDRHLNKKSVPKQTVKIIHQHVAEIENENQLRQRLRENFGDKLKIKDDPVNKLLYYDAKIDGKRYKTMARYKKLYKRTGYEEDHS